MHQFLPAYPQLFTRNFHREIASRWEFQKDYTSAFSKLYPHQQFIERFVSPYTGYDNLLLFHEMGSGKTQSAISVAENLMRNKSSGIVKTIVIVRGQGLAQNFLNELLYNSTDGKYVTNDNRKLWKEKYEFWTMGVFGKQLQKFTDNDLIIKYNNRLFVVDEAHHLKQKSEGVIYYQIHRLFHILPYRKVLLLSGTPMKDDASELANSANLILPITRQLPYGHDFNDFFFDKNVLINKRILLDNLSGFVSFYRGKGPNVKKVFKGDVMASHHVPIVRCAMDPFQKKWYDRAYGKDEADGSIYINSRQASLFVFPDGSFGKEGFKKYVRVTKKQSLTGKSKTFYSLAPELERAVIDDIGRYSTKYKMVLDAVMDPARPKTFIYSEFVQGSGAILLSQILKLYGYSQATGAETKPGKRFILATTQTLTANITKLISKFNSEENANGELIQIFIGSQVISEGFSLKNVRKEFILTPHWNFSELDQIIARCWRINSHEPTIKNLEINLMAVDSKNSIDLYMYKITEIKDFRIKQVERLLKEISVDCHNVEFYIGKDGSRECDYTDCRIDCLCDSDRPRGGNSDQTSYRFLYPPTAEIVAKFSRIFAENKFVHLSVLINNLGFDKVVLLDFISHILYTNTPIYIGDRMMFLRKSGNLLFATKDPTTPVDSIVPLSDIDDRSITPQELVSSLESDWLLDSIKMLFEDRNTLHKIILYKLPRTYQHLLLTACIYARLHGPKNAGKIVDIILDYYKGFYKLGKTVYVWLFHEQFGTIRLAKTGETMTWETSPKDIYQEMRQRIYESSVGYYGLYNPHLDEFCLRKVMDHKETDLRKVAVGRRCDDWDQKSLVDIINKRLKLGVDVVLHNRVELCTMIRKEMFARNLVMYNFDCGNQFKIRGRV